MKKPLIFLALLTLACSCHEKIKPQDTHVIQKKLDFIVITSKSIAPMVSQNEVNHKVNDAGIVVNDAGMGFKIYYTDSKGVKDHFFVDEKDFNRIAAGDTIVSVHGL